MDKDTKEKLTVELAEKVYDDMGSPIIKEVGGFFGAVASFFNNVVAAPLHRLNAKFKIKTQVYIEKLYKKYLNIPEENRQEAPINIVGPALESLKYELDDDELSELFSNLLLSSMDNRKSHKCHPAYVKIITQMDSIDAITLKGIYNRRNTIFPVVTPKCAISINFQEKQLHGYHIHDDKFPDLYIGSIQNLTIFEISKSLYNLSRLGIIEIHKKQVYHWDFSDIYEPLIESEEIKNIYNSIQLKLPGCSLQFDKGNIEFTEFGKDFVESIIKD